MTQTTLYRYTLGVGDKKLMIQPDRPGGQYSLSSNVGEEFGVFLTAEDATKQASMMLSAKDYALDIVSSARDLDQWDRGVFMNINVRPAQ